MQAITYRGLKLHLGTRAETFQTLTKFLVAGGQHQVITLNPEYVVLAKRNQALVQLTQRASLSLVDGTGLAFAVRRFGLVERYPGADLVPELCTFCATHQMKVGMVLLPDGLSTPTQVQGVLKQKFPNLNAEVWYAHETLSASVQKFQPALLFVALGQPHQDFWIAENLKLFPSVHVAIGVGGAVDFLTGTQRRAPSLMRSLGLEWLWRLVTQPRRFARIFRATFGFWYTILFQ